MDVTTAVRTDTLPAIATVIAAGGFATAPYAWVWVVRDTALRRQILEMRSELRPLPIT